MSEPIPPPNNINPTTVPFQFGKYSQAAIIGAIYEKPIPMPNKDGYKMTKSCQFVINDHASTPPMPKIPPITHKHHGGKRLYKAGAI